jgi:hypothetical protein
MSALGQKAKYSLRAHIVRFAPESGLKSDIAGGPFRANSGSDRFYSITSSTGEALGVTVMPASYKVDLNALPD